MVSARIAGMRRTALIILGAAAGLVALVLIAVAVTVATVDPNRYVAPLAARVKAATGRDLSLQGPVDFKLSLEPKVVLPGVAFQNAPWAAKQPLLTAKRIEVQIALLPLLSRRFEIVRLTLVEPVIALETDAQGKGNWEFAPAATPNAAASSGGAAAALPFGIANFEIRQGVLTYRNGATGRVTTASIDSMEMRARDLAAPVAVEFRGKVDDVAVALSGDLGPPATWLAQRWPYPVALKGEIDGNKVKLSTQVAKAAGTTTFGDLDIAYGAIAAKGTIRAITANGKMRYAIDLTVPSLSVADLSRTAEAQAKASAEAPGKASAPTAAGAHWIIPDTPLPLGPLAAIDAEGTVAIGELKLHDGRQLQRVAAKFTSQDAKVDLEFTAGSILGGSMRGRMHADAQRKDSPTIHFQLDAEDLDLAALAAAGGVKRDIRGGKVRASVDITGHGTTPHGVASTMSGSILVVSGPATLGRSAAQGDSAVSQIAGALDPLHGVDAVTELKCAVFRLPLADGIAHVDRSIAIETGKIAGSASGTLNFRDETLDLSVQPQIREGVKIDVSQFAGLVRIRGRFDKPSVAIDAAQSAQMLAKIGVLGATGGGLAVIGGALLGSTGATAAPCAVAMSGKSPRDVTPSNPAQGKTASPAPSNNLGLPKDLGQALDKLLKR